MSDTFTVKDEKFNTVIRRLAESKGAPSVDFDRTPQGAEEQIASLQLRIVEYEKYSGPIATAMIESLRRQIDQIRAKTGQ